MRDTLSWALNAYLTNREQVAPLLTPLATIAGSLATLIVGVFVAWAALSQARINRLRHVAQTNADLQSRITESFTKAVEQLSSDKPQIRLGGIYVLERISRESKEDYRSVIEMLIAFVRERALWKEDREAAVWQTVANFYEEQAPKKSTLDTDIATVLAVLVRRIYNESYKIEQKEGWRLDLSSVDLRGAELEDVHLRRASLSNAHLEGAILRNADLEGAIFRDAHLQKAHLQHANLKTAKLNGVHLEEAKLHDANLEEASLSYAHLEEAELHSAYLRRAFLGRAHLQKAKLNGADLEKADLREAHLHGAELHGAKLAGAIGLEQSQLDATFGDETTTIPTGMTRPLQWKKDGEHPLPPKRPKLGRRLASLRRLFRAKPS